jgi:hypothetical protein
MAHTPGPWDIMFNDDVERIRLNGSSLYQVADVTDPDFPTGKPRYNLADLRLMAAAPELLAACKLLLDYGPNGLFVCWCGELGAQCDNCIVADAIAKAEGRSDGEDRRVD